MNTSHKKEFILEGLGCANCAAKMEDKIKQLNGVSNVSINFMNKTLSMEIDNSANAMDIVDDVKNIVKSIESHVIVKDKETETIDKKVLLLKGLGCANCAAKIEAEVNKLDFIKSASVDFVSTKLNIELNKKININSIVESVENIVKKIEPDVVVVYEEQVRRGEAKKQEEEEENGTKKEAIRLGIGAAFFIVGSILDLSFWPELIVFLISYIIVGGEIVLKALKNITRGQIFDENFLMSIATIGAFAIGEFPEGVAVMLFYQVGELFQDIAVNRSRKSIAALMDIRPDYANLKVGNEIKKVSPEEVSIGDIIVVKPGEKIPLDGKIIEGNSMVDTSALTGESVPREVEAGHDILSGCINKNGVLTIEVTKEFGESTVAKILDLVQNASSKKAPTENFITKFARYYTPVVVIAALLLAILPPLVIQGATFSTWIYRALVFLVISCPCALVVSIPLGFFGGIGGASKNGVLIKGSNYLEALNDVDTVVFDKTGTLTKGVFKVTEINSAKGINNDELLEYAAYAESYSNHPIAQSILKAYGKEIDKEKIESYDEISGHGTKVKFREKEILAGNVKLMKRENISYNQEELAGTVVHMAVDGKYAGYILISDEVKDDSARAIKALKSAGVRKTVMLTGDNKTVGYKVAKQLGLDEVYAELLPDQKVEKVEMLDKQKTPNKKLIFVGDGINDAPVLARADIGVAMGGLGSDAAIEAADVVLMTDEPMKLVTAIKIAKRTRRIVLQNIIFALGVKFIVLILGAVGIASMWTAVFADVGVSVLAVINAMRALKVNKL
ncbi:heavy metal translocating P-type ATPase [Clostridium kluyveri]|uniref:heavy metal translocating P-type ATPase n=1 Tax=Clostridium kluyveri TaxID=1534 RepID=UPI0022464FA3|nr:heavy metal translocating P-type ATPase [Clostridium kluyveri]UZQ48881.1 heavy metal translocating P-type ATPase [Clostridium kluyveri]